MSLQGKVAIVTGASRGIGKAIAAKLAAQGAIVVGTATTEAGAEAINAWLSESGGAGMMLNVAQPGQIEAFIDAVQSRFGAPLILVNNAGITRDNLLLRMKDAEWDDVIATNLTAIFRLSKACLKGMGKARWGRIINISSVVGLMGNPGQTNYAAAKAGLEGFSRSLAREMGSRNITVNSVAPGFIATDMTHALSEAQQQAMLSQIPAGRLGQPEDIAEAVAFLAGDTAAYITGVTLPVNGGMYM
ncbi:MAG: 3-oxoacyl-ACP reductase FabG [Fluviicoccus sp.]|uniref:3-oxoacyl-ACP reductase FabG n=1 Tax=Fluviicoccus sp. TaxID=2003552 RepID=UPI0027271B2E|nr:3-oxoacyl-ACP reductase FabG [Fluviicoccus sp.]MDO8330855.1 3-oxoacyl-ACP reductase FabG [Fluviicoccus sp.]